MQFINSPVLNLLFNCVFPAFKLFILFSESKTWKFPDVFLDFMSFAHSLVKQTMKQGQIRLLGTLEKHKDLARLQVSVYNYYSSFILEDVPWFLVKLTA